MRVLTAAEMQRADKATILDFGIPGSVLMEHAARAVAETATTLLEPGHEIVVLAGAGNNAGDGWAAARLLHLGGYSVRVVALVDPADLRGDALANARSYERAGGPVERLAPEGIRAGPGDVIVDAVFGTGLSRPPEGDLRLGIEAINAARVLGAKVLAVDLPSGLSADTGRPLGVAVFADVTVTFAFLKRGLVLHPGAEMAGQVKLADISIPPQALAGMDPPLNLVDDDEIRLLLRPRPADSNKGTFGHCLVVAGSAGKTGAAALSARGALVGGAGLVTVASRPEALPFIMAHAPEIMGMALPGEGPLSLSDFEALSAGASGKAAVLMGPGIPRADETGDLVGRLLETVEAPFVLDADALNAVAGFPELLRRALGEVVVTPHPGEMARLMGSSVADVQAARIETAQRFAGENGCTVVLKGAGTVIASPDGEVWICQTGNPGLATGGTGDVLAGLVASQLAQGLPAAQAARVAVFVHGLAADEKVKTRGQRGLVASDLLDGIAGVWAAWNL